MRRVWHPRTGITVFLLHLSTTTELFIVNLVPQHSEAIHLDESGFEETGVPAFENHVVLTQR